MAARKWHLDGTGMIWLRVDDPRASTR